MNESTTNASFLSGLLQSVADRGRALVGLARADAQGVEALLASSLKLLTGRGEASGAALAQTILSGYVQAGCCAKARVSPRRRRALRTRSGGARRGGAIVSRPSRRSRGEQARRARPSRSVRSCCAASITRRAARSRWCACARTCSPTSRDSGTRRVRPGLPPSLRFVVQPGVSGAAADRLDDAGQHSGEDHPLRSGARRFTASRICAGASSRAIGGFTRSSIPRSATNR